MTRYRVMQAFGSFRKGEIVEPTGIWRGRLLAGGYIELLPEVSRTDPPAPEQPEIPALLQPPPPRRTKGPHHGH